MSLSFPKRPNIQAKLVNSLFLRLVHAIIYLVKSILFTPNRLRCSVNPTSIYLRPRPRPSRNQHCMVEHMRQVNVSSIRASCLRSFTTIQAIERRNLLEHPFNESVAFIRSNQRLVVLEKCATVSQNNPAGDSILRPTSIQKSPNCDTKIGSLPLKVAPIDNPVRE